MTGNEPVDDVASVEYGRFARDDDAYNRLFTRPRYLDALARAGLHGTWHELPEFPRGLAIGRRTSLPAT